MRTRNKPLRGMLKASPIKQKGPGPTMPKDHPVKPPKLASEYKTEAYNGPKYIGGSAPNPAKSAANIAKAIHSYFTG